MENKIEKIVQHKDKRIFKKVLNYTVIEQAEQYIKIGIKGKKIVSVDWHDLIKIDPNIKNPQKKTKKYLIKAVKFLKKTKKTKVIT